MQNRVTRGENIRHANNGTTGHVVRKIPSEIAVYFITVSVICVLTSGRRPLNNLVVAIISVPESFVCFPSPIPPKIPPFILNSASFHSAPQTTNSQHYDNITESFFYRPASLSPSGTLSALLPDSRLIPPLTPHTPLRNGIYHQVIVVWAGSCRWSQSERLPPPLVHEAEAQGCLIWCTFLCYVLTPLCPSAPLHEENACSMQILSWLMLGKRDTRRFCPRS